MDEAARRRRLWFLLVPIICLIVASNVGNGLSPTLAVNNPALLLALDARIRNVVLVSGSLDAVPYYVIGTLRLLLSDPLFYLLGYWYGEAALSWVDRKAGGIGSFLREAEGFFSVAAYPLLFLMPNNYICLFAGAARMNPLVFLGLNASGTVARLVLIRYVGDIFAGPRESLLGFISEYQLPLTAATIVLVIAQVLWEKRKGSTEIEQLAELGQELEGVEPRPPDAPGVDVAEHARSVEATEAGDDVGRSDDRG